MLEHREEILGELLGMIEVFLQSKPPERTMPGRFRPWAQLIDRILRANGISDFLSTLIADGRSADVGQILLEELALAMPNEYLPAAGWLAEIQRLNLDKEQFRGRTVRANQTLVGQTLRGRVGREILPEGSNGELLGRYRLAERKDRNGMVYAFIDVPAEPAEPDGVSAKANGGCSDDAVNMPGGDFDIN
jgi:hypothetical protein